MSVLIASKKETESEIVYNFDENYIYNDEIC